ncbi:carbamoyl-phosphate-synthetase [Nocardia colli]|uniref:Carbamoyl-phosphate-synthetase n=1 Tax=Nocardia colli TaxID=2545717 RepID=A0A5N0EHK4_9NOCA|nr:carbamoyl-phosphate-synthetase [Nocardia colli]KAA8888887.1 carbamoyl-phosphate-synthetase [Nocardia colli]
MRVLLTEVSSLTAREFLSVLGPAGYHLEALSASAFALGRWSVWLERVHRGPAAGADPEGFARALTAVTRDRAFDAVLSTHEDVVLFADRRSLFPADLPLAISPAASVARVASKLEFARLADDLGLPQPDWVRLTEDRQSFEYPYYVKAAFGTAGNGVRLVTDDRSRVRAPQDLARRGPLLAQRFARGEYAQVQGMFEHGRLAAVHTSEQRATGIGGSAAARVSVDHELPRKHIALLGDALAWHGGLTMDYFHEDGVPQYIECNPRTVEPFNAAASGVDLPVLAVRLARGDSLPDGVQVGRPGVRTHSLAAISLGVAATTGRRRAVLGEVKAALAKRGTYRDSTEALTPPADPLSLLPLAVIVSGLLLRPRLADTLAARAVRNYAVLPARRDPDPTHP